MRQKILIFLLMAVFAISQVSVVEAKGGSKGGSRSSVKSFSSSSKSSGGYSGSSKKGSSGSSSSTSKGGSSSSGQSSGGYSGGSSSSKGSSSSGSSSKGTSSSGSSSNSGGSYSGSSSSRSVPGSYSSGSSSKKSSQKVSYMQDYYKKQASQSNYKAYQQKLNNDQKKVYDSSMNSSYKLNKPQMRLEDALKTRPQRINSYNSRPIRITVNSYHFGGSIGYGSAFVGPWDLWFLMRASDLFWYHHWHDINPYRDYFEAAKFAEMESRIRKLEAQNIARNADYMEPDVDYDLQLSNDYQQRNIDKLYYTDRNSNPVGNVVVTIIVIIGIVCVLLIIIRVVSKPRRAKSFNSKIY